MTRVSDFMTRLVVTVRDDATLAEALTYLATQHISGAAVTDRRNRLVGVVSRSDIIEAEVEVDESARGRFLSDTVVRDVMSTPALTVGPGVELREAALAMEYGDVHRLFVEEAGKLVGILSRSDVSRALASGRV